MNKNIPLTRVHSYNVSVAADIGINAAVIFYNICYWVEENTANDRNYVNGEHWTYNTVNAFKELFPEMTYEQVRNALRKLEDNNYIKSAFLNEDTRDRTKWYTVVDKEKWIMTTKCNCENSQMDCEKPQMENDESTDDYNIYNNKNTNTDNKQSNNNQSVNKHTDNSHREKTLTKVNAKVKTVDCEKSTACAEKEKKTYDELKADEQDLFNRVENICEEYFGFENSLTSEIVSAFRYYFERYTKKTGKIHPILTDKTLINIIGMLTQGIDDEYGHHSGTTVVGDDIVTYKQFIDRYFDSDYGKYNGAERNYHMPHFATNGILSNLAHEIIEI